MTRIDRRKLLTSGAAAAVLASAGLPLAALPKKGGRLRAGLSGGSASDSFDPRAPMGLFMLAAAQGAVFDTLTEVAPNGSLRGELAESWTARDAARVWTVKLRDDVAFHDGTPLQVTDVIASLSLHQDPAQAAPIMDQVARMTPVNPNALRFELTEANPNFPYLLADPHLTVAPQGNFARAIGTGLYRVEDFDSGRRLTARRVAEHYKDNRAGWFDEIEFFALNDAQDRLSALTDRHVDVVDSVELTDRTGFLTRTIAGQDHTNPGLCCAVPAFRDYHLSAHQRLNVPQSLGNLWPMDNARLAERWWMA